MELNAKLKLNVRLNVQVELVIEMGLPNKQRTRCCKIVSVPATHESPVPLCKKAGRDPRTIQEKMPGATRAFSGICLC